MKLSDKKRRVLAEETSEAAWNLVDDLSYVREVVTKQHPTSGDLRRMSNVLRRALIDQGGDIRKVAAARLEKKLHLMAPDIHETIEEHARTPLLFISEGEARLYGSTFQGIHFSGNDRPAGPKEFARTQLALRGVPGEPPEPIALRLDNFLAQKVLFYRGEWIKRSAVIKYVANVAGGVHSGIAKDQEFLILQAIREIGFFTPRNGMANFRFHLNSMIPSAPKPIAVDREGIDFVLLQLMAAARYLVISPDVHELEQTIRSEQQ